MSPGADYTKTTMEDLGFTEAAAAKIRQLVAQSKAPALGLRVGVRGGGCAGYSYFLELAPEGSVRPEKDVVFEAHAAKVVVDRRSLELLQGTTLDWVRSALQGSRFVFENPKAKRACGCGSSFAV